MVVARHVEEIGVNRSRTFSRHAVRGGLAAVIGSLTRQAVAVLVALVMTKGSPHAAIPIGVFLLWITRESLGNGFVPPGKDGGAPICSRKVPFMFHGQSTTHPRAIAHGLLEGGGVSLVLLAFDGAQDADRVRSLSQATDQFRELSFHERVAYSANATKLGVA